MHETSALVNVVSGIIILLIIAAAISAIGKKFACLLPSCWLLSVPSSLWQKTAFRHLIFCTA